MRNSSHILYGQIGRAIRAIVYPDTREVNVHTNCDVILTLHFVSNNTAMNKV